jgi:hypothetical protein
MLVHYILVGTFLSKFLRDFPLATADIFFSEAASLSLSNSSLSPISLTKLEFDGLKYPQLVHLAIKMNLHPPPEKLVIDIDKETEGRNEEGEHFSLILQLIWGALCAMAKPPGCCSFADTQLRAFFKS